MRLNENEAQALLEEYTGPRYEIERHTMVINLFFFFFFNSIEIDLPIITCGSNNQSLYEVASE